MATNPKKAAAIAAQKKDVLRKGFRKLLKQNGIESSPRVSFRIAPTKTATKTLARQERLRKDFQEMLEVHGIEGWHLTGFSIKPTEVGVKAALCPQNTHFECRNIGGTIVCDCFPD